MIDAHAHLNFPDYARDLPLVLERAREAGVEALICVGTELNSSRRAVELASGPSPVREKAPSGPRPEIYAAVGFHPLEAGEANPQSWVELAALARHPRVVAVGETGLDFYREKPPLPHQEEAFRRQIEIARNAGLPLIIHARDSLKEVREILEEEGLPPAGGVMHCFGGDEEEALEFTRLGLHIGLGGPVTFKNAARAREVARRVPLERLILETDCPFLSPHPYRGQRNEPSRLSLIAREIAHLRGVTVEEVDRVTSANARRLFRLPEPAH